MKQKKLHKQINMASNRKILRQQMVLLAEYSRLPEGREYLVPASYGVRDIYRELLKAKRLFAVGLASFCVLFGLLYGFGIKFVKLFKSK